MRSGTGDPNSPESAAAEGGGTLVWVGPTDRPECIEAFRYCAERALQIAPRRTLKDLLVRPAERVGRVVVVRMDRAAAPHAMLRQLEHLFPAAKKTLLLGAGCEGESRTGEPWPQCERLYWHRWNQVVPGWFADPSPPAATRSARQNVAVIASSPVQAEGLLDAVAALGHAVLWQPTTIPASARNIDVYLWDDSAAAATSTTRWRERLARPVGSTAAGCPRHAWVVGFPRIDDWAAARRAGVTGLISKPFQNRVLRDFIDS